MASKKKSHSRGGSGHEHTSKAKRMARHVTKSEEKRGMKPSRAKRVGWATVHKDLPHKQREEKEG